jgi:hypothetical protein
MNLSQVYDVQGEKFKLLCFQTQVLLGLNCPKVYEKLREIDFQMYCLRWFLSFFALELPFGFLAEIIDFYLYEQSVVLVRIACTLFIQARHALLLAQDSEEVHNILRQPY